MKVWELFKMIQDTEYVHTGLDGDYQVIVKDNTMYILFQESTSKQDWKHNLQFLPVPIKPYKNMVLLWYAHKGFVNVWKSMEDEVMKKIYMTQCTAPRVDRAIIAGWSMGGALAQLCAEDILFHYNHPCPLRLITFGSPAVFYSSRPCRKLQKQTIAGLYENGSDVVPKLPPFARKVKSIIHIGEPFNWLKVFRTPKYHTDYGNETLYKDVDNVEV